jgi:hypothetical protein
VAGVLRKEKESQQPRLALNQSVFKVREDLFTSEFCISYPTLVSLKERGISSSALYPAKLEYVVKKMWEP